MKKYLVIAILWFSSGAQAMSAEEYFSIVEKSFANADMTAKNMHVSAIKDPIFGTEAALAEVYAHISGWTSANPVDLMIKNVSFYSASETLVSCYVGARVDMVTQFAQVGLVDCDNGYAYDATFLEQIDASSILDKN